MSSAPEGLERLRRAVDEVAATLPVKPRAQSARPRPRRFERPALTAASAAALVLAVLGYPAYLGWFRLPALEREVARLQASGEPPASYILSMPRAAESLRGTGSAEVVQLPEARPGQPWLLLVELDPESFARERAEGGGPRVFEIQRGDGETVWSQAVGTGELTGYWELLEGVPLLLPPGGLAPGRYQLRLLREGSEGRGSAIPFEVVGQGPARPEGERRR